ncbi:hypothetical protein [Bradyrhizobium sp. 144]|uniref:hypothetical protein n=1 Tax=Bradyrhizobium sp. 144 TaxID=2782620 RepID=UPI001FF8D600|nr:hypothetical protein [Bradyrhizobium sp. 144]MCK1698783.1 hypothetical protein [Bradyrhizobium sp. 144]
MKIRQYRERCGVLADLGELLQEISEPGAHPTPRPSGTIKATDIRNPLKARSTLAETSSYNSSVCGPAIRPPVTYENGGRNTGSVKPKFGAASRQRHEEQDGAMPEYGEPAYDRTDPVQTWLVPSGLRGEHSS